MTSSKTHPARAVASGGLAVEVTPDCNRECLYCYNGWRRTPETREPVLAAAELVKLVSDGLLASGRNAVQFSGGEPLSRPDFFTIAAGLAQPGRVLSLVTDGGLIDAHVARRLKELSVGPVQPTLLATDRTVHDELKGVPGAFDATIRAIEVLGAMEIPTTLSFVCTAQNADAFASVLELAFALGIKSVAFSRFCAAGAGAEVAAQSRLTPSVGQLRRCLDAAVVAEESFGLRVHMAITLPLCVPTSEHRRRLRFGRCALGTASPGFTIDPWGRLRACSVSGVTLGDLRRESWGEIMRRSATEYFPAVRRLPEACGRCSLAAQCGGGCRESARTNPGGLTRPDPLATL
jgi:radical SAM protein with 4Fe4S-binding SPASM domain